MQALLAIRIKKDKIKHREIFFKGHIKQSKTHIKHSVSEYATIDEGLEGFKYIIEGCAASTVHKQDHKERDYSYLFMHCESCTFYTNHMEICAGTWPVGPFQISNNVPDVIVGMIQSISGANRNLAPYYRFNSLPLVLDLLKDNTRYTTAKR